MSQSPYEAIFLSFPELATIHFRGKDFIVAGRVLIISEFLSKVNYVELRDYLLAVFPSKDQFFLVTSIDSNDLLLNHMSMEQIESVILKKCVMNLLMRMTNLEWKMRLEILHNKRFGTYLDPQSKKHLLLLDN